MPPPPGCGINLIAYSESGRTLFLPLIVDDLRRCLSIAEQPHATKSCVAVAGATIGVFVTNS